MLPTKTGARPRGQAIQGLRNEAPHVYSSPASMFWLSTPGSLDQDKAQTRLNQRISWLNAWMQQHGGGTVESYEEDSLRSLKHSLKLKSETTL